MKHERRIPVVAISLVALAMSLSSVKSRTRAVDVHTQVVVSQELAPAEAEETAGKVPAWLTWAAVGFVALVVMAKLLVLGHGDPATAAIILGANGFTAMWSTVALLAIPAAVLCGCCALIIVLTASLLSRDRKNFLGLWGVFALVAIVALALVPWQSLLWLGFFAFVAGLVRGWWTNCREGKASVDLALVALCALSGIIGSAFMPNLWIPLERIETSERGTIVGYIIANQDTAVTILREDDRTTLTVNPEGIGDRIRCQMEPSSTRWVLFMGRPGSYVDCSTGK